MRMKKWVAILAVFAITVSVLTACMQTENDIGSSGQESSSQTETSEPVETRPASETAGQEETMLGNKQTPIVYMTADISPDGLMAAYDALGWTPTGNVAVKLSTGEPPASNYLRPELIADLVQAVDGTIVECNTAYGGSRSETAMHWWQKIMDLPPLLTFKSRMKMAP